MSKQRPPVAAPLIGLLIAGVVWRELARLPVAPAAGESHHIAFACAALLPSLGVMLAMILVQMAARTISGTIDPTIGHDGRLLLINQRAITNTVEQLTVFVPALLVLAAEVPAGRLGQVVALALVFALARLAFWIGYLIGPRQRAADMAATVAVNVTTLAAAAWVWLGR